MLSRVRDEGLCPLLRNLSTRWAAKERVRVEYEGCTEGEVSSWCSEMARMVRGVVLFDLYHDNVGDVSHLWFPRHLGVERMWEILKDRLRGLGMEGLQRLERGRWRVRPEARGTDDRRLGKRWRDDEVAAGGS